MSHLTLPYLTLPYLTLPYLTLPYLALPYLTLPYLTLPYLTLPYLTLPYRTLPYLTLPYLTLPYLTLPYLTLPYLTLPYLTLPSSLSPSFNEYYFHFIIIINAFTQCRGHDPKDLFKVWKENCLIGDDLNFDKENVMQPSQSQKNKGNKKNNLSVQDKKTVSASGNAPGQQDNFPLPQSFASRNPVVVCSASSLLLFCISH
jgi:hypothetical protein